MAAPMSHDTVKFNSNISNKLRLLLFMLYLQSYKEVKNERYVKFYLTNPQVDFDGFFFPFILFCPYSNLQI